MGSERQAGREQRLVFGEDAELYDRARPAYPAELIDELVARVEPRVRVLDIGCGTGKATRLLAERGLTGVGVEPHPAMAALARRAMASQPGWRIDIADFERWQPQSDDVPFDLACCAQAWHWLDPEVRLHRVHDLLATGGWLALWWNTWDRDHTDPLRRAIDDAYRRHAPHMTGLATPGQVDGVVPTDMPDDLDFEPPIRRDYRRIDSYRTAQWLDLLRTSSDHRVLPADQRDRLLAAVGEAIEAHGGVYHHRVVTRLWLTRRR